MFYVNGSWIINEFLKCSVMSLDNKREHLKLDIAVIFTSVLTPLPPPYD